MQGLQHSAEEFLNDASCCGSGTGLLPLGAAATANRNALQRFIQFAGWASGWVLITATH